VDEFSEYVVGFTDFDIAKTLPFLAIKKAAPGETLLKVREL
jgi:hypothetical protein